jgi:putative phosphoribosyl transferase
MAARPFVSRTTAGIALAHELASRQFRPPIVVLGLARGGVPVAYEVARLLHAPLDVLVVRKIGMPGQPEIAIGAIASGNIVVHEPRMAHLIPFLSAAFDRVTAVELRELARRERVYRAGLGPLDLRDKTVILVDDGLATGSTMLAAVRAARKARAAQIIAAAPVGSQEAVDLVAAEADAVVVSTVPPVLSSIGEWYLRFEQLEDREVCHLLASPVDSRLAHAPTHHHHHGP